MDKETGLVLWLTGISGSGKTTVALKLREELSKTLNRIELLDGDRVRDFFNNDLGYSRQERIQNVKRIAFAAKLLADHCVFVIVANIAPYIEVREFIRNKISSYIQVYVKASQEEVIKRDVKGLYVKFKKGELTHLISMDDPYEPPRTPDITLETEKESVDEEVQRIMEYLENRGKQC